MAKTKNQNVNGQKRWIWELKKAIQKPMGDFTVTMITSNIQSMNTYEIKQDSATAWAISISNTCDCGELQRWLNIGHIDDYTGAELRFVLVLVCLILFFFAL